MLAELNDFGNRETFADGVEGKRVVSDVPIFAASGTHQALYADAGVEGAGNGAAVADLAEDDVVMQLHLHLLATIDTLRKGDPQSGAGDIQDGSINWLARAPQNLDLGGILGGVPGFSAALGILLIVEKGLCECSHRMIELLRQRKLLSWLKDSYYLRKLRPESS
jgi:hypothetical protein